MQITENFAADFFEVDRRTIKRKTASLSRNQEGKMRAREVAVAIIPNILSQIENGPTAVTLNEARTRESLAKSRKTEIEIETLEKGRIPIEVMNDTLDAAFGEIKSIIEHSPLSDAAKDQIYAELVDVPTRLKW